MLVIFLKNCLQVGMIKVSCNQGCSIRVGTCIAVKGAVHSKMNILSSFADAVPNLYD